MQLVAPILYAEDDRDDAFFMELACKQAGIIQPLVLVWDGQQAIDYLAAQGEFANRSRDAFPRVLLLDLKLPRKTGFEVLKWIGEQGLKALKVIVVSSSGQQLDIDLARKMGALDYVIKPSSPNKLRDAMRSINERWLSSEMLVER